MNIFVKYRYIWLGLTVAIAVVCGIMMPRVNINTNMTKYLPDNSKMREGLSILDKDFAGMSEMGNVDVRIMFDSLSRDEINATQERLKAEKEILSVRRSENGIHTLYEMDVVNDIDQRELGARLCKDYRHVALVETSHDGAAADFTMLLTGVIVLLIILLLMCKSWFEPVLFLLSTGIAVIINIGSNVLLESVSMTTNSIVGVLQFVLSMDYSIILSNRYRQEKAKGFENRIAMGNAVRMSSSSILSSAATTIVGLIVLVFMKLKIGEDLGLVLAKGVLCSLICTYTILPALLVAFDKVVVKSEKKVLTIPTRWLSWFSIKYRICLTILFVALFAGTYILHKSTEIKFSTNGISKINEYFPKKNVTVVMYDTKDEMALPCLADSLMKDSMVNMVVSYPSILMRQYTSGQITEAIDELKKLQTEMTGEETNITLDNDNATDESLQLSDEMLRLVYYSSHMQDSTLAFKLDDIGDFIIEQANNPESFIAKKIDDDTREKLDMYKDYRKMMSEPAKPKKTVRKQYVKPAETTPDVFISESPTEDPLPEDSAIREEKPYNKFTDKEMLTKEMNSEEMAEYLGMDDGQAKMIYKMAKRGKTMSPVEYVHYVRNVMKKNKIMAAMASREEKKQFYALAEIMDNAMAGNETEVIVPATAETEKIEPQVMTESPIATTSHKEPVVTVETTEKESRETFANILDTKKEYTSKELKEMISAFDINIDEWMVDMLYLYYGSKENYDSTWTMSLEEMVNYIGDNIVNNEVYAAFVNEGMKKDFNGMREKMVCEFSKMRGEEHSLAIVITRYKDESPETYKFIGDMDEMCRGLLRHEHYFIGESAMFKEMKDGFSAEMTFITWLTILAIFVIVAITFRSLIIPTILVITIMTAVFANVAFSGLGGNRLLYLAYLIVQSILMGSTIDYGILFTNSYREQRKEHSVTVSAAKAYKMSIDTILTSGLIMIVAPAILSMTVQDVTISDILKSISIGALVAVILILTVLPGVLVLFDRFTRPRKKG